MKMSLPDETFQYQTGSGDLSVFHHVTCPRDPGRRFSAAEFISWRRWGLSITELALSGSSGYRQWRRPGEHRRKSISAALRATGDGEIKT